MVVSHPLSCLPWLASGLVPDGQRYYGGSDYSAEHLRGLLLAEFSLVISIELLNIPSPTTA
ncbi:hypothetical protein SAMN06265222_101418 [Neorhodopirellula lusitana]|uniref:Uncharacterized protein n=1 Tax=Neorhodopirellula lusitana TaxID=445327 RepID=A0ABY1PP34_9BACT|nr:hypothetical protein SAMN06265222_101418 [Neorhodopirellula lusitana]